MIITQRTRRLLAAAAVIVGGTLIPALTAARELPATAPVDSEPPLTYWVEPTPAEVELFLEAARFRLCTSPPAGRGSRSLHRDFYLEDKRMQIDPMDVAARHSTVPADDADHDHSQQVPYAELADR